MAINTFLNSYYAPNYLSDKKEVFNIKPIMAAVIIGGMVGEMPFVFHILSADVMRKLYLVLALKSTYVWFLRDVV